ncbi:hypothetical protein NMY22_g2192 [Coprinellus aureogranulatus]|nr:hypothetical protein NMY22_g2192 [Coprinellus aureogranulatus]
MPHLREKCQFFRYGSNWIARYTFPVPRTVRLHGSGDISLRPRVMDLTNMPVFTHCHGAQGYDELGQKTPHDIAGAGLAAQPGKGYTRVQGRHLNRKTPLAVGPSVSPRSMFETPGWGSLRSRTPGKLDMASRNNFIKPRVALFAKPITSSTIRNPFAEEGQCELRHTYTPPTTAQDIAWQAMTRGQIPRLGDGRSGKRFEFEVCCGYLLATICCWGCRLWIVAATTRRPACCFHPRPYRVLKLPMSTALPLKVPATPARSNESDKDKTPIATSKPSEPKGAIEPKDISSPHELTAFVENLLEQLDAKFDDMSSQILERMSQMSTRVDALESSIQDIINGDTSTPQSPSPMPPSTPGVRRNESGFH